MIIGSCPYENCDGEVFMPIADKTPCFSKDECEKCGRVFWTLHSRFQPKSWTEEFFKKEIADVDEETREIKFKEGVTMDGLYFGQT